MALTDPPTVYYLYGFIAIIALIFLASLFRLFFVSGEKTFLGSIGQNLGAFWRALFQPILEWAWRNFLKWVFLMVLLGIIVYGIDFFIFDGTLFGRFF